MNRFVLRRLTWLDARASDLEARGEHGSACQVWQDLCSQIEHHLDDRHPWLVRNLLRLAASHRALGQPEAAEQAYCKAIEQLDNDLDPGGREGEGQNLAKAREFDLAQVLNTLGVFYCEQGRPQAALAPLGRALEFSHAQLTTEDPRLATLHNNLGSAHHSLDQLDPALHHYGEALGIFELGRESLEQAHCLCDLAELLTDLDLATARQRVAQASAIFRRLLSDEPTELARSLVQTAGLRARHGDYAQAVEQLEQAAQLLRRLAGQEELLAQCFELLGHLERERGVGDD